ncbi:hypothetical protein J437_LFUL017771 [Ladona fulva]|uniref:Uncharacterized protein n=1 Tax=Ladona fulva TaxID=123851 RepID=A0A8K0KQ04_LADFU|nr:hypothetical protein J437_LFUL017771 [Ladona fulva]
MVSLLGSGFARSIPSVPFFILQHPIKSQECGGKKPGLYGLGMRNERGEKFVNFCVSMNLCLAKTCYKNYERRLYT